MSVSLAIAVLLGYLLGSIPFGVVLTRIAKAGDLREIGSGNIGATNVLRTGKKGLAFATLLLDGGKGAAAVGLAQFVDPSVALIAGGAAFLGHLYPVWLRFKGGKGVATFLGLLLALAWPVGLACAATWLITAYLFRMSSFAALVAATAAPFYVLVWSTENNLFVLAVLLSILILLKHSSNLQRIIAGLEPRIGRG